MGLKEFFTVLSRSLRVSRHQIHSYHALTICDDLILNRVALDCGMLTLPKGQPNDPSEHWILAKEE